MKYTILLTSIVCCLGWGSPAAKAQSYEKLWAQVEANLQKDLPKSAAQSALAIYQKAQKEHNAPQMMKSYLVMTDARHRISEDSLQVDLEGLKRWAAEEKDSVNAAVLYSLLGEICQRYDRTADWRGYLLRSVQPMNALGNRSAKDFLPMVEMGDASLRYEQNRMYPVLARRAITILGNSNYEDRTKTRGQLYGNLQRYFLARGEREAYVLTVVDSIGQMRNSNDSLLIQRYRQLIAKYGDVETIVEAYDRLASLLKDSKRCLEAMDLLEEGIRRFPKYRCTNKLRNARTQLLASSLSLHPGDMYPGKPHAFMVSYRNLSVFDLKVYKLDVDDSNKIWLYDAEDAYWKNRETLYKTERYTLKPTSDLIRKDTALTVTIPEEGYYRLEAVPVKPYNGKCHTEKLLVHVYALNVIVGSRFHDVTHAMVIDRMSGKPVPNAKVEFYAYSQGKYAKSDKDMYADSEGLLSWTTDETDAQKRMTHVRATTEGQTCMPLFSIARGNTVVTAEKEKFHLAVYSDRGVYRPGQTVYVSGIMFSQKGDSLSVREAKQINLTLKDVNGKSVGHSTVSTNDFGSFKTTFALPTVCLNGRFTVEAEGDGCKQYVSFLVEEYKRPQYEVKLHPVTELYKAGDTLWITGTATQFSGAPVQRAEVEYSIGRRGKQYGEWSHSAVQTDSVGAFRFPIPTEQSVENVYDYSLKVTSLDGETQELSSSIWVRTLPCRIYLSDAPAYWIKEEPKEMQLIVKNMAECQVTTEVEYEVFRLEKCVETDLFGNRSVLSTLGERLLGGSQTSGQPFSLDEIYRLPSDNYRMKMRVKGGGTEACDSLDFTMFSLSDTSLPAGMEFFVYTKTDEASGVPTIYMGTTDKDLSVFYCTYLGTGSSRGNLVHLSNELKSWPMPLKENELDNYGDFIVLYSAFAKNGRLSDYRLAVEKPMPDKRLKLKWKTFRDHLTAGGNEEWRLQVLNKDGQPATAELMATLYDASLDKNFNSSAWRIPYNIYRSTPYYLGMRMLRQMECYMAINFKTDRLKYSDWTYTKLVSPFGHTVYGLHEKMMFRSANRISLMSLQADAAPKKVNAVAARIEVNEDMTGSVAATGQDEIAEESDLSTDASPRTNFAETAFFYPQLRTNEQGEVDIVFTLPESLTTWHLKGLAHNKAMDCAVLDTLAVASKEFMLQASLPRFLRVRDKATLSATLSNLTQKSISGTVRMELFDPVTEKTFHTARQSFSLKAGGTMPVAFTYTVSANHPVMACRMVAEGNGYSDGEQHLLPVLDKKEPVVEAVSVTMTQPGTLKKDLSKLFNNQSATATNRHLTVEFTGNPAWLAVLALPSVESPSDHNACSLSAAYYASLLSTWMVEHNPRIRTLMDAWKAQGANAPEETLQSELQRNPELKELLLEASPFVEDADREAQQRRLCQQFDLNTLRNQQELYISKLKDLQTDEGGWSWYKGMRANRYMTLTVMETLLRAKSLTGVMNSECTQMVDNGFGYLDGIAKEIEKEMRKDKSFWWPGEFVFSYLYLNHLAQRPLDKELQKTCDYFMKRVKETTGKMTIYGKAVAAQLFDSEADASLRGDLVKTLLEYSVATPEMGRYYDTFLAEYTWSDYRIPTESMVIETLQRVGGHDTEVAEMRQWLLQQKRVQSWDTPLNTVNAVYALLLDNTSLLADKPMPKLRLDGEQVGQEPTIGLNSVKETLSLTGKQQAPSTFTVEKTDDGLSYGAVYARYTEEVDKLAPYAEGLSIRRDLYVERSTKSGTEWEKVTADTQLRVGDKVKSVLTLKADRDMDFIQVKENRASCMEPLSTHSGYRWGYYLAIKDATMEYYMDKLTKGTHTFESLYYLTMPGTYEMGTVKVQSAYAPAFGARTGGQTLRVQR